MKFSDKNVFAFFQPIISIDSPNDVYGYEILGRYVDDNGAFHSLGPYFANKGNPLPEMMVVDYLMRMDAFKRYAASKSGAYLFLNMRLDWISMYSVNSNIMPPVPLAHELGLDPSKLVIEITEEEYVNPDRYYKERLNFYRGKGSRLAIDDFGKSASNIERISDVRPDILKFDMSYIHKSENNSYYREYMNAITAYAERLGIEVVYEGIETVGQLDVCVSAKGRFYQGFLLGQPTEILSAPRATGGEGHLEESARRIYKRNYRAANRIVQTRDEWDAIFLQIMRNFNNMAGAVDINAHFRNILESLPSQALRIYVCDETGRQRSVTIERDSYERGSDPRNVQYRNLAWRRIFQEAVSS
ncbi:MAG: EAL domain-containing protein, partial [Planctomycetota bacterium]|nr:EAL domain-containing protein [Planctomycetota bacterium]